MANRRVPKLVTKEKMEKLSTSRLKVYEETLLIIREHSQWGKSESIKNKQYESKWEDTYAACKEILASRRVNSEDN